MILGLFLMLSVVFFLIYKTVDPSFKLVEVFRRNLDRRCESIHDYGLLVALLSSCRRDNRSLEGMEIAERDVLSSRHDPSALKVRMMWLVVHTVDIWFRVGIMFCRRIYPLRARPELWMVPGEKKRERVRERESAAAVPWQFSRRRGIVNFHTAGLLWNRLQ